MPMVRDRSHFTIERKWFITEARLSCSFEVAKDVRDLGLGWVDAMRLPDGHRDRTDFAVGDPTRFVLVIPMGKPGGLA